MQTFYFFLAQRILLENCFRQSDPIDFQKLLHERNALVAELDSENQALKAKLIEKEKKLADKDAEIARLRALLPDYGSEV